MNCWLIAIIGVLLGAAIICAACYLAYRKQVKAICRQIRYINTHETNMIVTGDYNQSSITALANEINEFLTRTARLRQELLHKESTLKDTITSLSHDIRTPLTSLDGYFQLLQASSTAQERQRYISIVKERIVSLDMLLEELFTYAKLQDGSYPLSIEQMPVNELLYEGIFSFYEDFRRQNIEPIARIADERIEVRANYTALKRAMHNVIKNALEHGEGFFTLKLERCRDKAVISVQNGVSSAGEIDIEHVFDRFYKADAARQHSSSGLGLAIAKQIVEKMGGSIAASIEKDVFTIEIRL